MPWEGVKSNRSKEYATLVKKRNELKGEYRMDRKFLEDLGLEKEVIDKIMEENGKDIEKEKKGVDKLKSDNAVLTSEKERLEGQLQEANGTIEELSKIDAEKLQEEVQTYKKKFEESEREKEAEIKKITLEHEIEKNLLSAGAKNLKAVKALLDIEEIEKSNELTKTITTQIENLKESDGYLFETTDGDGDGSGNAEVQVGGNTNNQQNAGTPMTYTEMLAAHARGLKI